MRRCANAKSTRFLLVGLCLAFALLEPASTWGESIKTGLTACLRPVEKGGFGGWTGAARRFVVTHTPLAATHVDAVRAVLDFVRARYDGPLTLAEGPSVQLAAEGFCLHGYEPPVDSHSVTLADLNHDEPVPVDVYDWRLRLLRLHLARSVVETVSPIIPADAAPTP